MIKKIKSVNFSYNGKIELDKGLSENIKENWNNMIKETDLLHESEILVVSNLIEDEGKFEIELMQTQFSHFMYAKKDKNMDLRCMFSGAYIVTSDNFIVVVLNNMYKDNAFEMLNLVGGMSDAKDIIDNTYYPEQCLKREVFEELGLDITNPEYSTELKYIKYPSKEENPVGYAVGMIFEIKTKYTKQQINEMFEKSSHDNEIKSLIFFSKDNYKDINKFEHKKSYMPELWENIFNNNVYLKVPSVDELAYRKNWLSDPKTMKYNAGYDIDLEDYDKNDGTIKKNDTELLEWYRKWTNKEPNRYYAYIYDSITDEPVGEIYYYLDNDIYSMGILISNEYRGKGYSCNALKELEKIAFEKNEISELSDFIPIDRINAIKTFEKAGFIQTDNIRENKKFDKVEISKQMLITREMYENNCK